MRGVYIVANDKVKENAIALMSSLRQFDPDIPVYLIPFNDEHQAVATQLAELYDVHCFPDLGFLDELTQKIGDIFPRDFLALPNKMRKLAAWFGPLDEFLYIDTDILFFTPVTETLAYLDKADFIWCDYHYKRGLEDVFTDVVLEQNIFSPEALEDVFNSGLWGSKKSALSLDRLYEILAECAAHREYFDFSNGTTDQPIMNYLVLSAIPKRLNIAKHNPAEAGSWGGSSHFEQRGDRLFDGEVPLRYLHWAGTPMRTGGPYRSLWEHYRYLHDPEGKAVFEASAAPQPSKFRQLKTGLKSLIKKKLAHNIKP
ncbi:MAG: Npun_R2821/Npun_R2822 family protein [Cyanobacteria bacterium J06643_4]